MHKVAPESLLDESDFLWELSSLENGMTENRRPPSLSSVQEPPGPVRTAPPGKFVDDVPRATSDPIFEDDDSAGPGRLATVGMFVLMVGVGAAGAMLVYHERVARIIATLRI